MPPKNPNLNWTCCSVLACHNILSYRDVFLLFIYSFIHSKNATHAQSHWKNKNFLWRVTKNVFIYKLVVDDDVVCFIHLYSIEGKICMLLLPMSQHRLFTEQTLIPFGIFFSCFISLSFGIMIKFNLMQTEIFLITFVSYPILYILSVNIWMKSVESNNQVDRIDLGVFQHSINNHASDGCSDLNLNRIGHKKIVWLTFYQITYVELRCVQKAVDRKK